MHDTVIFLILAGIALIFRFLGNRADTNQATPPEQRARPNEPPPTPAVPRAPAESEQERVRRFLEALGMPEGSEPPPTVRPPPVGPRRVITPARPQPLPKARRRWVQPLPPLVTTPEQPPELPPILTIPEPPTPPPAPPTAPILLPVLGPITPPARVPVVKTSSLGEMLRAPGSARRAMILREILGPPRGLQTFDPLSGQPR